MDSTKQMNDYWHIPRASLALSSASSATSTASSTQHSNKSCTPNIPTMANHSTTLIPPIHVNDLALVNGTRRDSEMSATSAAVIAAAAAAVLAAAKRGSHSSQGSNDSNHSTRSAASGSLLLTAANLERFAEIHRKPQKPYLNSNFATVRKVANNTATTSAYNANLMRVSKGRQVASINIQRPSPDTVISIDPNLNFIKTKDPDSVSIASSMHFTMINGEAGAAKKPKSGLCDRGRQVSVLIISMSTLFLLLILGMIYALEMRAREMPQS